MMNSVAVATASALDCVRPTMLIMTWPPPVSGPAVGSVRQLAVDVTRHARCGEREDRLLVEAQRDGLRLALERERAAVQVLPRANRRLRRVMKVSMSEWRASSA